MKRTYIEPQTEVIRMQLGGMIATSGDNSMSSSNSNSSGTDQVGSRAQSFGGGLWSNMVDDDAKK